jgi:hypothetical protein
LAVLARLICSGTLALSGLLGLAGSALLWATDDPRDIVRRALDRNTHNSEELERNYTYTERNERRILDGSGAVKRRLSFTYDVMLLEGAPYRRLIQRNDLPLTPQEQRREDAELKKKQELRRKETPEERRRLQQRSEGELRKERQEMNQILDGFDLRLVGEEEIDGMPVWVVDGAPRPGFKGTGRTAYVFMRMKGRIWVSKSDYQPVKIDAEAIDTISIGGIMARIDKGTRFHLENIRINDEIWLPKSRSFIGSGRVLLIKGLHVDFEAAFSGYKKFSADSRLVTAP